MKKTAKAEIIKIQKFWRQLYSNIVRRESDSSLKVVITKQINQTVALDLFSKSFKLKFLKTRDLKVRGRDSNTRPQVNNLNIEPQTESENKFFLISQKKR